MARWCAGWARTVPYHATHARNVLMLNRTSICELRRTPVLLSASRGATYPHNLHCKRRPAVAASHGDLTTTSLCWPACARTALPPCMPALCSCDLGCLCERDLPEVKKMRSLSAPLSKFRKSARIRTCAYVNHRSASGPPP